VHVLLVEPEYYTRYPSLGLLKISTYQKQLGNTVEYIRGKNLPKKRPDKIYVTSLFTWAWKPVHDSVQFYKKLFPESIIILGGIYASLLPEHASLSGADKIHVGLCTEVENLMPDYNLIPEWDSSIIFTSRGCIRKCGFCAVPKLEGKPHSFKYGIKHLIHPNHKKVVLWDNNFLANSNKYAILDQLYELKVMVDFNQGIDARLITDRIAEKIGKLRFKLIKIAYDTSSYGRFVKKAIERLECAGVNKRSIEAYTLYNYQDDSEDFFNRVKNLLNWGVVSYPMRYEPLVSLKKNRYVGYNWEKYELDNIAKARRVLGFFGVFPPYEGLVKKFNKAKNFDEAFKLRPPRPHDKLEKNNDKLLRDTNIVNKAKEIPKWGGSLFWRENYFHNKKLIHGNNSIITKGDLDEKTE